LVFLFALATAAVEDIAVERVFECVQFLLLLVARHFVVESFVGAACALGHFGSLRQIVHVQTMALTVSQRIDELPFEVHQFFIHGGQNCLLLVSEAA